MLRLNDFTRTRAFLTHLGLSAFIFTALLGTMLYVWYPHPFFDVEGGWEILILVGGVDIILGPVLTLIVFKPGKKTLKMDLSVIILIQVAALIYGGSILFQERPGYAVFTKGAFIVVPASQIDINKFPDAKPGLFSKPKYVVSVTPIDPEAYKRHLKRLVTGNIQELATLADLYQDYDDNTSLVLIDATPAANLMAVNDQYRSKLQTFLEKRDISVENTVYVPFTGKRRELPLLIDKTTGDILGALDIDLEIYLQKLD